jgi:hypothetical protein
MTVNLNSGCDFGCISNVTAGVNFINMLRETFFYKSLFCSFSLVKVWLCNFFCLNNIGANAARKILVKLTIGGSVFTLITFQHHVNARRSFFKYNTDRKDSNKLVQFSSKFDFNQSPGLNLIKSFVWQLYLKARQFYLLYEQENGQAQRNNSQYIGWY